MKRLLANIRFDTEMTKRYEELKRIKQILEKELANYPSGKIHIAKSKGRVQYYLRRSPSEQTGEYLGKNKQKIIKSYVQKDYDEKVLNLIGMELELIEKFLLKYGSIYEDIKQVYSAFPESTRKFINPVDMSDEEYAKWWSELPYEGKGIQDGRPAFLTDRGEYVRSKSELHIANTLNKMNIPYKYECPLELRKGIIIHPDFTVLNVKKRKKKYWEHRGMMDDREYARHSVSRMKDYEKSGIRLGQDLIITEETSTLPLSTQEIRRVIEGFLVD